MIFRKTVTTIIASMMMIITSLSFVQAGSSHNHHQHGHGSVHHGDLVLTDIRIRALMPGAKVSAGYLEIMNNGSSADRLIAVSIVGANKSEIHTMSMDNGVMKMRPLKDGIEIPAGEGISLVPGGYHLMFMKLDDFPKKGEMAQLTLTFEKAGSVSIEAPVMKIKPSHGHNH